MDKEKEIAIKTLKEFCEDNDYTFRENYSGKCMFGRTCVGICGNLNPLHLVLCLADLFRDNDVDNVEDILGEPRMDSMALDTIVYFPSLSLDN